MADDDRRISELEPPPGPPRRASATPVVQLGSPGRAPFVIGVLAAAFVLIAIVKPWPAPAAPGSRLVRATPTAAAEPTIDPLAIVRRECQEPPGWRTYTQERWSEWTLHAWTTISPAEGHHAPIENGLPTVPYATEVLELGFCAPYTNAEERPPDGATLHVWRVDGIGSGGGTPRAVPLDVTPSVPGLDLPYGMLIRPPSAVGPGGADRWPPATYVFEVVGPGAGYDRWWAVEIDPPLHPLPATTTDPSPAASTKPVP